MKKIIVPVDFSEYSENALQTASYLAKKHKSEIIILHVLELSGALKIQSEHYTQQEVLFFLKIAENKLDKLLKKEYLQGINITSRIEYHNLFEELNELATKEDADLIIMGSQGATGLKELFVGSNTEKVVRNSPVPVLVVKEEPVKVDFKTAVFACDFSEKGIEPYKKVKTILEKLECNLQLLHVNTPYANFRSTRETEKKVHEFLMDVEGNLSRTHDVIYVSDYSVEKGILDFASLNDLDLIVIATHGRKGLTHFIEGSISEDVANHSSLPVMTLKI